MNNLSITKINKLHMRYAPSETAYISVFGHCEIVWEITKELIRKNNLKVDEKLVMAGALLHDIGVYEFWDGDIYTMPEGKQYVKHAVTGADILKDEGLPKEVQDIVTYHLGVGISKTDIIKHGLDLPHKDMIPTTTEQRLVSYADSFNTKSAQPYFRTASNIKRRISLISKEKVAVFDSWIIEFGLPDLEKLSQKHNQKIES
jgi:uncharacterized protein